MAFDIRTLAVPTAGFATFLNLYSPQALLPRLSHEFNVSAGEISALITAATAAIALTAPFTARSPTSSAATPDHGGDIPSWCRRCS